MAKGKAPGKHYRKSLSLDDMRRLFPTDKKAEKWFRKIFWKENNDEPICPYCRGTRIVKSEKYKTREYCCEDCGKYFSLRTGTLMDGINMGYSDWVWFLYSALFSPNGTDLESFCYRTGTSPYTAKKLLSRFREALRIDDDVVFNGPVEVDDLILAKRIVVIMFDRLSGSIIAKVVPDRERETIQNVVLKHTKKGSIVITDRSEVYKNLPDRTHYVMKKLRMNYDEVDGVGKITLSNIYAFWSKVKIAKEVRYSNFSPRYTQEFLNEFVGKRNIREEDSIVQFEIIAENMYRRGNSLVDV